MRVLVFNREESIACRKDDGQRRQNGVLGDGSSPLLARYSLENASITDYQARGAEALILIGQLAARLKPCPTQNRLWHQF